MVRHWTDIDHTTCLRRSAFERVKDRNVTSCMESHSVLKYLSSIDCFAPSSGSVRTVPRLPVAEISLRGQRRVLTSSKDPQVVSYW